MAIKSFGFRTREELAQRLAADTAQALAAPILKEGKAVLAVSGGSTPILMFEALSRHDIPWQKVFVTPVDERWVDPTHERSNARLIQTHLLKNAASAATFIPLYRDTPEPEDKLAAIQDRIEKLGPPSAVILGMGIDGHTASFFPQGDHLATATNLETTDLVLPIRAPGAGETRITITLPWIISANFLALHIEGKEKSESFERALSHGPAHEMPIRSILSAPNVELKVYWTG